MLNENVNKMQILDVSRNIDHSSGKNFKNRSDHHLIDYITERKVCVTVNLTGLNENFNYYQTDLMNPKGLLLIVSLRKIDYFIFLNPMKLIINMLLMKYSDLLKTNESMSYKKFSFKKLGYPYKSDCLDYHKLGFDDRLHALFTCYDEFSSKLFNSTYHGSKIYFDHKSVIRFTNSSEDSILEKICENRFKQQDCEIEFFFPEKIYTEIYNYNDKFS